MYIFMYVTWGPIIQGYYKRNRHFQRCVVSPDLTPCDFFLWGYTKDRDFVPPLPVSLNELKNASQQLLQELTKI